MSIRFACNMTALPREQRGAHHALIRRLMTEAVEEISELADGLTFRFPPEEYDGVTEFVGRERLAVPSSPSRWMYRPSVAHSSSG